MNGVGDIYSSTTCGYHRLTPILHAHSTIGVFIATEQDKQGKTGVYYTGQCTQRLVYINVHCHWITFSQSRMWWQKI